MSAEDIIFITDSHSEYQKSQLERKLLFTDDPLKSIETSNFLSKEEVLTINESTIADRLAKGDEILKEVRLFSSQAVDYSFSLSEKTQDQHIGISNLLLRNYIEKKYALIVLLEQVLDYDEKASVRLNLSETFSLFSTDDTACADIEVVFRKDKRIRSLIQRQTLKNNFYIVLDVKRRFSKKEVFKKKKILFLVQSAQHHHELLNKLYHLIHDSKEYEPIVVVYSLSIADNNFYKRYIPEKVRTIPFEAFRGYIKHKTPRKLFSKTKIPQALLNYAGIDTNYNQVSNMIHQIKPEFCVTVGYQETGKYLSDVAKIADIPCVSIDYSFIANLHTFQKFITYDYKFCISEAQRNVWKKLGDQTTKHIETGFLKYDNTQIGSDLLLNKLGLNEAYLTVFFASSHGFTQESKEMVLERLISMCDKNNYNLIIKTHPLELDDTAIRLVGDRQNQVVISHDEYTSMQCVSISDIVISQGSSIVLDALYFLKPYITLSNNNSWVVTDDMPINEEPFVFKAKSIEEIEKIIFDLNPSKLKALQKRMNEVRKHYLYITDGNASKRVFDHLTSLVE